MLHDMAPAPGARHQDTLANLGMFVRSYVRQQGLGRVFFAPLDVKLSEEDVVQPDLLFVTQERRTIITDRGCEGTPDLVVEVLSPSTSARDRGINRDTYAKFGVQRYWLIDAYAETVDILKLDGPEFVLTESLRIGEIATTPLIPGLKAPLAEVFAED